MGMEEALMSKQIRNIIIAVVVVLLLVGSLVLIKILPASQPEGQTTTAPAETTTAEGQTAAPDDGGIYLTQNEEGNLDTIEVTNEFGSYTLEQPQKNMWIVKGYEDIMTGDAVPFMVDSCGNFKVASVIEKNCTDFSKYGLDKPVATIRIKFRDASEMTVYFGDANPASSTKSRYLYVKNGKEVYEESVGLYTAFSNSVEELFSTEMLSPQKTTDSDGKTVFAAIDSITLGGKARDKEINITANKASGKQSSGNLVFTESKMIINSPISAPLDTSTESGRFGTTYSRLTETGITASTIAKVHPTDADKAEYGLVDPAYTLKFTSQGKEFKFYFSELDHQEGVYYAMDEFGLVIFRMNESSGKWIEATLDQLAPKQLYEGDPYQLSRVTVKTEQETRVFDITQLGDFNMTVKSAGKDVDLNAFRRFFDMLCGVEWVELAQNVPTIGGKDTVLEVRIEYAKDTGYTQDVITLTKSSARRYFIGINGKGAFVCDTNALNNVLSAYEQLLS